MILATLGTARLALEPFTETDLDDLCRLNADPEVTRFLFGVRTREDTVAELGRILAGASVPGCGGWAIRRKSDRAWVGRIGIKRNVETGDHELLYALLPAFWREGYTSEAAAALLAHTFARGVDRVMACADPENAGSIAVMKKIGMTFEGRATMYGRESVVYAARAPR